MSKKLIKVALVGAGMFGGDVHLRTYADAQRFGIAGMLGRVGLDAWSRELADVSFELVAIGTRTGASAQRACERFKEWTGHLPEAVSGEAPWDEILSRFPDLDVLSVATPDHLHTPAILAALDKGAHVVTEKPMCLSLGEADQIIGKATEAGRVVAVDMHKRYDPDHLRIRDEIASKIGEPLYGQAYLEEPIEVSTSTFKWVEESDPFSYVGPHWTDLIHHYFGAMPVSLTAVGQKKRLRRQGIDAYDSVQVRVDYDNGMSIHYHNNWITPEDFEGPVNQGHELVGTDGKVESDQQDRGFRFWSAGGGCRTANNHFTREVKRPDGSSAYVGYGVDSLTVSLVAICGMKFRGMSREGVASLYPTAEDSRVTVAIVEAAKVVRDFNFESMEKGEGACASARFGRRGIEVFNPTAENERDRIVRIYERSL